MSPPRFPGWAKGGDKLNVSAPADPIPAFDQLETRFLSEVRGQKPSVAYLCSRVPHELIEALGAILLRITSSASLSPGASIRSDGCAFCRSVPDTLRKGRFKDTAAVVGATCCDQMRRLLDTLQGELPIPMLLYSAPRTYNSDRAFFMDEMRVAFAELGGALGRAIDPIVLSERIEARQRLRERVSRMRDAGILPARLLHRIAASPLPAEQVFAFLEEWECRLQEGGNASSQPRLMLLGSIPDDRTIRLIEEAGGSFVADGTCLGDRSEAISSREDAKTQGNSGVDDQSMWNFLYDQYVEGNNCAFRRPLMALVEWVGELAQRRRVDGVIYRSVKFCHPWGQAAQQFKAARCRADGAIISGVFGSSHCPYETAPLVNALRERGIPTLAFDVVAPGKQRVQSQIYNRMEAFMEMLRQIKKTHAKPLRRKEVLPGESETRRNS